MRCCPHLREGWGSAAWGEEARRVASAALLASKEATGAAPTPTGNASLSSVWNLGRSVRVQRRGPCAPRSPLVRIRRESASDIDCFAERPCPNPALSVVVEIVGRLRLELFSYGIPADATINNNTAGSRRPSNSFGRAFAQAPILQVRRGGTRTCSITYQDQGSDCNYLPRASCVTCEDEEDAPPPLPLRIHGRFEIEGESPAVWAETFVFARGQSGRSAPRAEGGRRTGTNHRFLLGRGNSLGGQTSGRASNAMLTATYLRDLPWGDH